MGRLTTHVLDTMAGGPAAGLAIEVWTVGEDARRLKTVVTGSDGRAGAPAARRRRALPPGATSCASAPGSISASGTA